MRLTDRQFEQLVTEGLAMIPPEIRRHMENIQIIIQAEPAPEVLANLGIPDGETLYGLYEGVPLDERTLSYSAFPDRITIYREPLVENFADLDELRYEVARTVIHEVAHHFGIDEDRLRELGWD